MRVIYEVIMRIHRIVFKHVRHLGTGCERNSLGARSMVKFGDTWAERSVSVVVDVVVVDVAVVGVGTYRWAGQGD